jgi:hypothetical protein
VPYRSHCGVPNVHIAGRGMDLGQKHGYTGRPAVQVGPERRVCQGGFAIKSLLE